MFPIILIFLSMSCYASTFESMQTYYQLHPEQQKLSNSIRNLSDKRISPKIKKRVSGKTLTIVTIEPSNQLSDYWTKTHKAIKERLKQYGILLNLTVRSSELGHYNSNNRFR